MANYKLEDVEAIVLAEKTGLSEARVLRFANMVDLYRVSGVGSEYAEPREVAGADTVPELTTRNAAGLTQAMSAVKSRKKEADPPGAHGIRGGEMDRAGQGAAPDAGILIRMHRRSRVMPGFFDAVAESAHARIRACAWVRRFERR